MGVKSREENNPVWLLAWPGVAWAVYWPPGRTHTPSGICSMGQVRMEIWLPVLSLSTRVSSEEPRRNPAWMPSLPSSPENHMVV